MKQRFQIHMGVGTISLLMIFVVLCMVILSSLSFLSAKESRDLALREKEEITAYYTADAIAVWLYQQIEPQVSLIDNYEHLQQLDITKQQDIHFVLDEKSITIQIPVAHEKKLQICVQADGAILSWGVIQEEGENL